MKSFILCLIALPYLLFAFPLPTKEISIPFLGRYEKEEQDVSQVDKPATVRVLIDKGLQGALHRDEGRLQHLQPKYRKARPSKCWR